MLRHGGNPRQRSGRRATRMTLGVAAALGGLMLFGALGLDSARAGDDAVNDAADGAVNGAVNGATAAAAADPLPEGIAEDLVIDAEDIDVPAVVAPQVAEVDAPAPLPGDDFEALRELLSLAPSRHLSQPGNAAIDAYIERRFAAAAAGQNEAQRERAAEARSAFERAEAARDEVRRAALDKQLLDDEQAQAFESPWFVQYTLEEPLSLTLILLALTALFALVGWIQGRRPVLYAGAMVAVLALLLPALAWLIETEAERAVREADDGARTRAQLEQVYTEAMREAGRADREAAAALDGLWQHGRVRYPVTTFEPGEAHLSLGEVDAPLRVHQMVPNLVDPSNLPEAGFEGRVIYLGHGRPEDLAGQSLEDAIVLMEYDSRRRWLQAVEMGAEAVVFLSPEVDGGGFEQSRTKFSFSPVSVPRFYLEREALTEALGSNWQATLADAPRAHLEQEPGRWVEQEAATDWLFIPGTGEGLAEGRDRSLVHLQAYKDSNAVVPELARGAQGGANLVLMLRLLEHFEENPPARSVLISAVNGHAQGLYGEDMFAFAAFADPAVVRRELEEIDRRLARHRFIERVYRQGPDLELLRRLVTWIEPVGGRMFTVKDPIVEALNNRRNRAMREAHHHEVRIERSAGLEAEGLEPELDADERAALAERVEQLRAEGDEFLPLLRLFVRYGGGEEPADLEGTASWALLEQWFGRTADRAAQRAEELARQRQQLLDNLSIRRRLMALDAEALEQPLEGASVNEVFDHRYEPLPAAAAVCLDLSFGSDQLGFFTHGFLTQGGGRDFAENAVQRVGRLADYALSVAEEYAERTGEPSALISTLRGAEGLPWEAHLAQNLELGSRVMHEYARMALTLTSVQDPRPEAFSPQDVPERINRDHFDSSMRFARGYLPMLVDAPALEAQQQDRGESRTLAIGLRLHTLDDFSVELATAEAPGALLLAWPGQYEYSEPQMLGEVRPWVQHTSDADGRTTLRGSRWRDASVQAFDFEDETFRTVSAALDVGEGMRQLGANRVLGVRTTGYRTRNLVLAGTEKIDLFGMTEALTLMPAARLELLTAQQATTPRHYSVAGVQERAAGKDIPLAGDGTASVFVEPGTQFKLTVRGAPVIGASDEVPDGIGFPSGVGRLRNLAIQGARDMQLLNRARLNLLEERGVTEDAARDYNRMAEGLLERMAAAAAADRPDVVRTTAEEGRGLAFRAYQMTMDTINDLIQAVVVVLGLIIPASFFLMKLITPFTNVNAQLGAFALLFALLAAVLQFVHPAFYIADTPQVIVLAFVILGLAVFVASVIASRFNTSMNQAIEESQLSESVEAPRGRLAGMAFMVGVNNMKRRRIRTTLTAATVVLVTFTSLSVMSVGRSGEPVRIRTAATAPYDGFVFARPGMAPIETSQLQNLEAHFARDAQTVRRIWVQERGGFGDYLPMRVFPVEPREAAELEVLNAQVVLGLAQAEDGLIAPMPIAAGRWFSGDDARELVLSADAAALLGYGPEDVDDPDNRPRLRLMGRELTLVGLVDDEAMRDLEDQGEMPLMPLLSPPQVDLADQAPEEGAGTATLDPASGPADGAPGVRPARPIDVAMVPTELAASMPGASYRSLSVKYTGEPTADAPPAPPQAAEAEPGALAADHQQAEAPNATPSPAAQAWEAASRLVDFQHLRVQVGLTERLEPERGGALEPGQYAMASRSTREVAGILKVAIPIALGATIIFNTMLGAVMERRREISIYNAIGLNPTHVMIFFLAESLVFGLVGAVAGYLVGQILSVLITRFDLIALNLNYSSLSVMLVIFITIATVLLSTIYPAAMAARAAVPSGQRKWSLPQPEGDEISLTFPFLYDDRHVLGVCAYLRDYMQQNTEASTGKFLARAGPVGTVPADPDGAEAGGERGEATDPTEEASDDAHDKALAMLFDVAPAPFDLGVNQRMEVYAFYDRRVGAYMLGLHLTRLSGQQGNWVTVNQPFLEAMRKRLLGWRSQRDDLQRTFCEQGEELFRNAQPLPTAGGELAEAPTGDD